MRYHDLKGCDLDLKIYYKVKLLEPFLIFGDFLEYDNLNFEIFEIQSIFFQENCQVNL